MLTIESPTEGEKATLAPGGVKDDPFTQEAHQRALGRVSVCLGDLSYWIRAITRKSRPEMRKIAGYVEFVDIMSPIDDGPQTP